LTKVAVLKTTPERVLEDYASLLNLSDFRSNVRPGPKTFLALEGSSWPTFYPAAMVPPWQIEGVFKAVSALGFKEKDLGVVARGGSGKKPEGSFYAEALWRLKIRRYDFSPGFYRNSNVVLLSTLRTHLLHSVSGLLVSNDTLLHSGKIHGSFMVAPSQICESLRRLKGATKQVFGVVDGTFAGDGSGPRCLRLFRKNILLAGEDLVAVDAVSAHMMGFDPMKIPHLRQAHDAGLGCADLNQIQVVGESIHSMNFRFHQTGEPFFSWIERAYRKRRIPEGVFGKLKKACAVLLINGLEEMYSHRIWWPRFGEKRLQQAQQTNWGKLLKAYTLRHS